MKKNMIINIFLLLLLICLHAFAQQKTEAKKVLILPFKVYAPKDYNYLKNAIPEMLNSRLFVPSKIEVIDFEKIKKEIKSDKDLNEKIAIELGKKFKADYVVWGSVTVLGNSGSIDARIKDLSGNKKLGQFFVEIKDISEIIPQLSRFASKARRYIEGKEEDFYAETLPNYYTGSLDREHPERGYYAPYFYPVTPRKEEPKVTRAKSPYGESMTEGLTKNLVIDLSTGKIGWAKEEDKEKNKNNATASKPPYPPIYPPQPYYSYSPPPYYYYYQEDEGILSKIWSRIWPFGKKEKSTYYTQIAPAPKVITENSSQNSKTKKNEKTNPWSWK